MTVQLYSNRNVCVKLVCKCVPSVYLIHTVLIHSEHRLQLYCTVGIPITMQRPRRRIPIFPRRRAAPRTRHPTRRNGIPYSPRSEPGPLGAGGGAGPLPSARECCLVYERRPHPCTLDTAQLGLRRWGSAARASLYCGALSNSMSATGPSHLIGASRRHASPPGSSVRTRAQRPRVRARAKIAPTAAAAASASAGLA